ncbi:recombinase family protein [Clostridium neuense]|uniref:Recombinase family protein n=1 Tax=Clostridium neuense TaxID=1728934 RepID=A0ABW8TN32_9CLOT
MKKITAIAARNTVSADNQELLKKRRVCAYCRVSTDSLKQMESFETQVSYYESYIKSKTGWDYDGVFADEGISGTGTGKRTEFNRMLKVCELGKVDLIITKSISRFARNTADCLEVVRYLKSFGVGVYFEKENINTLNADSEVILSILSSIAQDESRNISENVKWSIQKNFKKGKFEINTKRFLGYDMNDKGKLIVNKEEAEIVKRIYNRYLEGESFKAIKLELEKDNIKTISGNVLWSENSIKGILKNEKYYGDAVLQKTITTDFLTHKRVKNKGEVRQYYVEDSHPAIISKEMFQRVQEEIKRRASLAGYSEKTKSRYSNKYAFSGKIICGNCGSKCTRKMWGPGEKYRKYVWLCTNHIDNGNEACSMKAVSEEKLKAAFVRSINKIIENKEAFLKTIMDNINKVLESETNGDEVQATNERLEELKEQMMNLVRLDVRKGLDHEIYDEEYGRLEEEIKQLKAKKQRFDNVELIRKNGIEKVKEIENILRGRQNTIKEFDKELFGQMVKEVKVVSLVEVEICYKNGVVVKQIL